jgi:hypothetical protein
MPIWALLRITLNPWYTSVSIHPFGGPANNLQLDWYKSTPVAGNVSSSPYLSQGALNAFR